MKLYLDILYLQWDICPVLDLNDLRTFEKVAALRSFAAAARALELPRSSVSRSVARLETALGTRLLQRTTRQAVLTEAGMLLKNGCTEMLMKVGETVDLVAGFSVAPRGRLRISAGVGFSVHVLSSLIPRFLEHNAEVEVSLRAGVRSIDLVADSIDVAIHMGPLPDSQLVAARLGTMQRYLCAAPSYLDRRGMPQTIDDLRNHDRIETPGDGQRPRPWIFCNEDGRTVRFEERPRLTTNDVVTIHRLILNGGGLGVLSAFVCASDLEQGRLVRLLPHWKMPPLEVGVVYPSSRALSPTVRAFIDFLKNSPEMKNIWRNGDVLPLPVAD